MNGYTFYAPTRVLFGAGKLGELHAALGAEGLAGKKAMLVISDGRSVRENGTLTRVQEQLAQANVAFVLFDKVGANPLKAIVEEGAALARTENCDFVVAVGGGSVMDAAKVMAMYAPQPGTLWDYVPGATGKMLPLVNSPLPWVAVTTTAGTGSEVDQWGVVTNPDTNEKIGCGGQDSLFAKIAVVDPELMRTVPPKYTAYQGFDALFHSVEGYIANARSPMADMVQRAAIEHVGKYLARAVANGTDMEAREGMAFANTMSGYSMVVGALHERTRHGTRDERLPSQPSARSGAHHDFPRLFRALDRQACLRRTVCGNGQNAGHEGRRGTRGFPCGPAKTAKGLRRGRPENVRLRHFRRGVRRACRQRAGHDGRPVSERPRPSFQGGVRGNLPQILPLSGNLSKPCDCRTAFFAQKTAPPLLYRPQDERPGGRGRVRISDGGEKQLLRLREKLLV